MKKDDKMLKTLNSIKRIDQKGVLYEMNYTADYLDPAIIAYAQEVSKSIETGCSAFATYNTSGDYLLCRSYDYFHKDQNGNPTGLNVVVHLAHKGKLKSINVCDACWLNLSKYFAGTLDDATTDTTPMLLAPYMCVDGMNEAGLSASLLVDDLKDGEHLTNQNTGKTKVTQSMLLREILDNAHSIKEAIAIAKNDDVYSVGDTDLHIFLTEKDGNSAVFEWRQYETDIEQKLYVTYTNVVTNFFVGFDDGADVYNKDGSLKELFSKLTQTFNNYKYGYGHGYHRFNQIVLTLERYIQSHKNVYGIRNSVMEEKQVRDILGVVSQDPGTENTSFTQYSAIYNLGQQSVRFWMQRDYEKSYTFKL